MENRMQGKIAEREVLTDLSDDFALPDYQPPVKRLLRVRATVHPADTYIGGGNAELTGVVDYFVLYAAEDGGIYNTQQTGEYRFSVPVEFPEGFDPAEGLTCDAEVLPESVTGRAAGPRKLNLKCRLRSKVKLYGVRIPYDVEGADADENERLTGEMEVARLFIGRTEPISLADEIVLENTDQEIRVIASDGQVLVSDADAGSGEVHCRGEVCLKLLCVRDGSSDLPYPVARRIPFQTDIPVDGAEVNCTATASGFCPEVRTTVEDGRMLCEVSLVLTGRAQRNETIPYLRDLYSTARETEPVYTEIPYSKAVKCVCGNFSLGTALPLSEIGLKPGLSVVDISGDATPETVECERGKYILSGKCKFHLILSGDGEYAAQEVEVPFRFEMQGGEEPPSDSDLEVSVLTARARTDSERLGIDAEIGVSAAMRVPGTAKVLGEVRFGEEIPTQGAAYVVCFPSATDTLWDVGRRYHTPVSALLAKNKLPSSPSADAPGSLKGVRFLVI